MNEKEIMQWAIKGIEAEAKKQEKKLRRDLLLLQAHKKKILSGEYNPDKEKMLEKRIADARDSIELLRRKKAFLIVQLEN